MVPGDGTYRLRVRFPPLQFHRHNNTNGKCFIKGADVMFEDVELETRQD